MNNKLSSNQYSNSQPAFAMRPIAHYIKALIATSMVYSSIDLAYANPAHTTGINCNHCLPIPQGSQNDFISVDPTPVPIPIPTNTSGVTASYIIQQNNAPSDPNPTYTMTITEVGTTTKATQLEWQNFNISPGDKVVINQPSSTSVLINQATGDNSSSTINGSLTDNGTDYIINPNGVTFGANAVVNSSGLVVSTLLPTQEAINNGIANTTQVGQNMQASFTADGSSAFGSAGKSYSGTAGANNPQQYNQSQPTSTAITINQGAQISSTNNHAILMLAPQINNQGTVSSPGGQVIMAASSDVVYLQEAPTTGSQSDVRGLLVEVQTGGNVNNAISGAISANHGNVTLMGFAVNQQGSVSATTTLNENGTIRLVAGQGYNATAIGSSANFELTTPYTTTKTVQNVVEEASVTLGADSKTTIKPEYLTTTGADTTASSKTQTTAVSGQAQPLSRLQILAGKVAVCNGADSACGTANNATDAAQVYVPAGHVNITATNNPNANLSGFSSDASSIQIDTGTSIDVSGLDSTESMANNVISVKLQSTELADSPLQKTGVLFGQTVQIDTRIGSPLADIQTQIAQIPFTLSERLNTGGTITLASEGSINVQGNLDFSGGVTTYQAGYINTTELLNNYGKVINIENASPLMTYTGIYGTSSQYQTSYQQGANAGSLTINTNHLNLTGSIQAQATSGLYQRQLNNQASGGTLTINDNLSNSSADWQSIVFSDPTQQHNVLTGINDLVINSHFLANSGIQNASFATNNPITLADNSTLKLLPAGQLTLNGGSVDVYSNIQGANAKVNITTVGNSITDGHFTVYNGANIDLQGKWINDYVDQNNLGNNSLLAINGGQLNVKAYGSIDLKSGSSVDVSGGAWLNTSSAITNGTAGTLSLAAITYNANTNLTYTNNLTLDGQLSAYGLTQGGSVSLETSSITLSETSQSPSNTGLIPLQLTPDFFKQGGFANYTLTSDVSGITLANNTGINIQQSNSVLNAGYQSKDNADNIASLSSVTTLPTINRSSSSLTLTVSDINPNAINNSPLVIGTGSSIKTDNSSKLNFNANASISFNGSISDHHGQVNFTQNNGQGILLGNAANIDVSGTTVYQANALNLRAGNILDAGGISFNAGFGYVAMASGTKLNLSGTQSTLDLPSEKSNGTIIYKPELVGSSGGALSISAGNGIYLDGTIQAHAGSLSAAGGSLTVDLNNTGSQTSVMYVSENNTNHGGLNNQGLPSTTGIAYVSANDIANAGFSSVNLQSFNSSSPINAEIAFIGSVDLHANETITLDAPILAWQADASQVANTNVKLTAANVILGNAEIASFVNYAVGSATNGNGILNVQADLIQLQGPSVTDGFASVNLQAQDIQLQGINVTGNTYLGEFDTYSQLSMTANRIYPLSLSQFTLGVTDTVNGNVAFNNYNAKTPTPVLEAYGSLTVNAPTIVQNGNLLAPLGTITLQNGSTQSTNISFGATSHTSVSANGETIPFGTISASTDWLYPLKAYQGGELSFTPTAKQITVNAQSIASATGAVIDLGGGGDVMAYEFVPGLGGSVDVLAPGNGIGGITSYAIVPHYSGYAPNDVLSSGSGLSLGENIVIGAGSALAAGTYTLLPAHYALLPGAYLITPQASNNTVANGFSGQRIDGASIVSGFLTIAGTDIKLSQTPSQFVVESGSIAQTRSQYDLSYGNSFFSKIATSNDTTIPALAQEAGILTFNVSSSLVLPSNITAAELDISASNITVVKGSTQASGVVIQADEINPDPNNITVGSVFLGGTRSINNSSGNSQLNVMASTVTVESGATVTAPEIILAATSKVEVQTGAALDAKGTFTTHNSSVLETCNNSSNCSSSSISDSAILRVSTGSQDSLQHIGTVGNSANLVLDTGSTLSAAQGSILLDTTGSNSLLDGSFSFASTGGSLSLGGNSINLGEVPNNSLSGLNLNTSQLSNLQSIANLVLTSRSNINFYGNVNFGTSNASQSGNLVLDTANLTGINVSNGTSIDNSVNLTANTLTLTNASATAGNNGAGTGNLNITTNNLNLNSGHYGVSGFNNINFTVNNAVTATGNSVISLLANTVINTTSFSGTTNADTTINAQSYNLNIGSTNGSESTTTGVGAQLNINAENITLASNLIYKGGRVDLDATQNLDLANTAVIDVSASKLSAGLSKPIDIAAGQIILTSDQANVTAEIGSQMLLNSHLSDVSAGTLLINADAGQANLFGTLSASSYYGTYTSNQNIMAEGGQLIMNVLKLDNSLATNGFSELNTIANQAGFTGAFNLHLIGSTGNVNNASDINITSDQSVNARIISLAADNGNVIVDGTLNAAGDSVNNNAGNITVASNNGININGSLLANAYQQSGHGNGGAINLSTAHEMASDTFGQTGTDNTLGIHVNNTATLNVANLSTGNLGSILLAANRNGNGVDASIDSNSKILGGVTPIVSAVEFYNANQSATANSQTLFATPYTISSNDISVIEKDINAFMSTATSGNNYLLTPGIEITSNANLTLNAAWNFYSTTSSTTQTPSWRYDGSSLMPGILTLRAQDNISINQNITDGLGSATQTLNRTTSMTVSNWLESGLSWSYNIIAGADLSAANNSALLPSNLITTGQGSISLGSSANNSSLEIATGTGNITLNATGDLNLYGNSIFTAGQVENNVLNNGNTIIQSNSSTLTENTLTGENLQYASHGGNLNITAGGNINATANNSFMTDWLVTLPSQSSNNATWGLALQTVSLTNTRTRATTVEFQEFHESLAALAGGNITINTTGNLNNLTIAIPTTNNGTTTFGGGNLQLQAGGNIAGGTYYDAQGQMNIVANGGLIAGNAYGQNTTGLAPLIALGDSQVSILTNNDMEVANIVDPMLLPNILNPTISPIFFSYSSNSSVSLTSLTGNITLDTIQPTKMSSYFDVYASSNVTESLTATSIYPAIVNVASLQGNINILNDFALFPSATGNISLYAYDNISLANNTIFVPDTNDLPSASNPVANINIFNFNTLTALQDFQLANPVNHDGNPVLVSTTLGNISGNTNGGGAFYLTKPIIVSSGKDIRNTSFLIQHNNISDTSVITAAGNIAYQTQRNGTTQQPLQTLPNLNALNQGIQISGSGQLTVLSGGSIDLGTSDGIVSVGNAVNANLATGGANITALAGLAGGNINVAGFGQRFLNATANTAAYNDYITQYTNDYKLHYTGNESQETINALAHAAAIASYSDLSQAYNTKLANFSSEITSLMQALTGNHSMSSADALNYFANNLDIANIQTSSTFTATDKQQLTALEAQLLPYIQAVYYENLKYFGEQMATSILSKDKDQYELAINATTEYLFPGTTLLSSNTNLSNITNNSWIADLASSNKNYSYNTSEGWIANNGYSTDQIIKSMDIYLLQAIQTNYGNIINLGGDKNIDINSAIQTINSAENSGYGKLLLSSIFTARPDIQSTVRPDNGDISMFFSTIQTLQGGNIALFAPSGGVDAGLSLGLNVKPASDLGVIVWQSGDIDSLVRNDFQVNLQRVVTLGGGDIIIGSTEGSIDAGRGSAGTGALAAPTISYDANGNPQVTLLPDLSQSGIRSATPANSTITPGSIVLFAARGTINAGEAGIGGNNLFLDASAFKNTANISSLGLSVGAPAPVSSAASAGISSTSSVTASVMKSMDSSVANNEDSEEKQKRAKKQEALGILNVEILGYGD